MRVGYRVRSVILAPVWVIASKDPSVVARLLWEAILWELICHHTYKWHGLATDLSFYDSHGVTDAHFLPDGATLGSGALRFQPGNRVHVPTNPGWRPLVGVRVECTIRATISSDNTQRLIYADGAFTVCVRNRYLFAGFRANPPIYLNWDMPGPGLLNTFNWGLFPNYRLPANKWIRLLFEHDGLTQMRFAVDGETVVWQSVPSGVPGAGTKGICIGNGFGGDETFAGDIDEIKIWRLDPNRMRRQFLDRPIDQATAHCWTRYVQSLREAFAKHPDCAKKLVDEIRAAFDRMLRAISAQGPETRQRFEEVREQYARLWREGKLDGPEMRQLIADWCAWLRLVGIAPEGDDAFLELKQSECWKLIQRELKGIDCDPQAMALIRLIGEHCGCGPELQAGQHAAHADPNARQRRE